MFYHLLFPLTTSWPLFNVFQYITFRSVGASITSLIIVLVLGPIVIRTLNKKSVKETIKEEVPKQHQSKTGIPTMGGLLIIVAIAISVLLWMQLINVDVWIIIMALVGFGTIGIIDDYFKTFKPKSKGLTFGKKLVMQIVVSILIAVILYLRKNEYTTLLYLPFLKEAVLDLGVYFIPFAVLLLVSTSNAVNLTDGLDGLATGLVLLVAMTFTVLSYLSGRIDYSEYLFIPYIPSAAEITIISASIVGATLGFLWYNSHPAQIFMGDTGSLPLGAMIGVIALVIKKEVLLLFCGGVFVLEAISVIIQVVGYKINKKRIFLMSPIHHHFELKGWAESKIVLRFWIFGIICSVVSLSILKVQ